MDTYRQYRAFNQGLAQKGEARHPRLGKAEPVHYPRVAIYTGGGSSHSWLWFAAVFERLGFLDLCFVDELDIASGALARADVLAVSGGDTFGMAEALGPRGAGALQDFISQGGVYLGACAGAYLPLNSSKEPLNLFNWVAAKITNLSSTLPQAKDLPQKFCTPYGCSYVFHPVREELLVQPMGPGPFGSGPAFGAPLYGGPGMIASPEVEVLATYQAFTQRTRFLVERALAEDTLIGHAAVIRARLGQGTMYLFGPHFEHPQYAQANRLVADTIYWDLDAGPKQRSTKAHEILTRAQSRAWLIDLKRQVSNARIVALGLEDHPARWLIGRKLYEPAKFRVFCEAVFSRLQSLRSMGELDLGSRGQESLPAAWTAIADDLRALKRALDQGQDTQALAESLFAAINPATADFMDLYFQNRFEGFSKPDRHPKTAMRPEAGSAGVLRGDWLET